MSSKPFMFTRFAGAVLSALALGSAAQAQVVAASWVGDGALGSTIGLSFPSAGYNNTGVGQSFLSHASGPVLTVAPRIGRSSGQPITCRLYQATPSGLPGALLASVTSFTVPFGVAVYHPFDFSTSGLQLVSGQSYVFTLTVPQGLSGGAYGLSGDSIAGYTEGAGVQSFNSADASGSDFFVNGYDYSFRVTVASPPPCRADFNADGTVNPDDLSDFITCYFTAPSCASADFNSDSSVDPDDLSDFITLYFGGC